MKSYLSLFEDKRSCKDKIFEEDIFSCGDHLNIKCMRKIVLFPKKCPHCKSKNTFHTVSGIQANVWRFETEESGLWVTHKKFDFCFNCHKEFLLEVYVWKYLKKEVKKK